MTELAPPLETGWLPDTPIGDSLLRRFVANQADPQDHLVGAVGGRDYSRPGFLRLGFLPITRFTLWALSPDSTGASKPGGAAGPAVRGSPYGDGPGTTGAERGRAGDAGRLAGAPSGDPDLEVRGPDCGATPAACRPAIHPVPAGAGPAH